MQECVKRQSDTLEDIYPTIYFVDRLVQGLKDNFFDVSGDSFYRNSDKRQALACDYEYIQAQLFAISELTFNMRLQSEFALNSESDAAKKHIKLEKEMWSHCDSERSIKA